MPRFAVHEGDQVWVFDDGKLAIRRVGVLRSDRHQTLVASGIEAGELVIVSSLDAVTDGMAVRNAADQENPSVGAPLGVPPRTPPSWDRSVRRRRT